MNSKNHNETPEGIVFFYYKDRKGNEYSIDFGSEYKYRFESNTNVLSIEKNINNISFFYNEQNGKVIQNISLLVGANGSGKTSVLANLFNAIIDENPLLSYLILFCEDDYYVQYNTLKSNVNFEYDENISINASIRKQLVSRVDSNYSLLLPNVIYVSNVFETGSLLRKKMFYENGGIDLSNNGIIKKLSNDTKDLYSIIYQGDYLKYYEIENYRNILNFLCSDEALSFEQSQLFYQSDRTIVLTFNKFENFYNRALQKLESDIFESITDAFKSDKSLKKIIEDIIGEERPFAYYKFFKSEINDTNKKFDANNYNELLYKLNKTEKSKVVETIFKAIDLLIILIDLEKKADNFRNSLRVNSMEDISSEDMIDLVKRKLVLDISLLKIGKNVLENDNLLNDSSLKEISDYLLYNLNYTGSELVIKKTKFYSALGFLVGNDDLYMNYNFFELSGIESFLEFKRKFNKSLDSFIKFDKLLDDYFIVKFNHLSSGELAFFNLFSRLYTLKDSCKSNESLIILVDEVDLYMHPQWQKEIVSNFVMFCNTVFHDKKVQIIMTTNNAIPVSDVLKYNVVLLGQDKKQHFDNYRNTFGGNIFNLLNDTFFIKDGFIGSFAQTKIQELIDILYDKDINYLMENMDEIEKRINLIGEDLIKNKLLEILEQRLKTNLLSIKNSLNKFEERLNRLEERNNNDV